MRIAVISPPMLLTPPTGYGGMELAAAYLCKGLSERGHEVTLLAKEGSKVPEGGCLIPYEDENHLPRIIRKAQDICPFNVVADFTHNKLLSIHCQDIPQVNNLQIMSMMGSGLNPVFISHGQKRAKFPNHFGYVIHYGIDFEDYPLYEGPRENYMLYMGQHIEEKGIHVACELAIRTGIPLRTAGTWWGEAWYHESLRNYQSKYPDLIFIGNELGGQEKIDAIKKAKFLIHPVGFNNWCEAGALVVLEALAMGTPCLTSTNGCLDEYIQNGVNGYKVYMGDYRDAASDVLDAMAESASHIHGIESQHCRNSIYPHFSYERMAAEYEIVLSDVLNGKHWNV